MCILLLPLIGSPHCPTVSTMSLTVSMHKSISIRWLPECQVAARVWFNVEVFSHSTGPKAMVYNSILKDPASVEVTSLQPDTVYTSLSSHATWWDAMSHVMYTRYKQHKQTMKVKWSECKVQLKQKDNNCSCLCIIHSESEDASRMYFGITFTVIAVAVVLAIAIATATMVLLPLFAKGLCH